MPGERAAQWRGARKGAGAMSASRSQDASLQEPEKAQQESRTESTVPSDHRPEGKPAEKLTNASQPLDDNASAKESRLQRRSKKESQAAECPEGESQASLGSRKPSEESVDAQRRRGDADCERQVAEVEGDAGGECSRALQAGAEGERSSSSNAVMMTARDAARISNASMLLLDAAERSSHRLWIGNIDLRVTEFHLLKILQKFGHIKEFDFLFHKSGPLEGQPRGYCFVNYETRPEAERAIQHLNGKLALSRPLVVRWAHAKFAQGYEYPKKEVVMPTSLEPSTSEPPAPVQTSLSINAKIQAIEAKLKMMEENPDMEYCPSPESNPLFYINRVAGNAADGGRPERRPWTDRRGRGAPYRSHYSRGGRR
ncbi:putative RNA-binding protein 18 [Petromyzon marinus]|uniref:putative RNA-binding protein 18 n=1 Tax=Petromyzon marinus TaxID=7757 RepID=UPI003F705978